MQAEGDDTDARQIAPSADRNKAFILEHLREAVASYGADTFRLLEVASGTGQHAACFAAALPDLQLQPTEMQDSSFPSIRAWTADLANVHPPCLLDASGDWQELDGREFDGVYVCNMCHISEWAATVGLMRGCGKVLVPGGLLLLYGPFTKSGRCTTESNAAFDASLRARDPALGYRDIADVETVAEAAGLKLVNQTDMPANNFLLGFQKNAA